MTADPAPPRSNSLTRAAVSDALAEFMSGGWGAGDPVSPAGVAEVAAYCAKRRARLSQRFPGERLVFPAGVAPIRSNDTTHRFRPACDHVYLTGAGYEGAVLVMEPVGGGHEAVLYRRPPAPAGTDGFWRDARHGELWVGRQEPLDDTAARLQVDCRPLGELGGRLADGRPTRMIRGVDAAVDAAVPPAGAPTRGDSRPTASADAGNGSAASGTPVDSDGELATAVADLRLVKDEWEIGRLEEAVAATIDGFADVVRALPQALVHGERYLEGVFALRSRVSGNDTGYLPIVAAGDHATILHWSTNNGPVRPGDLLLLDAGVETDTWYTADLTRTLPVDGVFTPAQRRVYELVLAAQEAALAEVRPGAPFRAFHDAAIRVIAEGLADWGLLPVPAAVSLGPRGGHHRRYTLCGTGHMLGLDVHDCARARTESYLDGVLEAGHVLTVEPGLYFQRGDLTVPPELRGIGVRIEDDVLVTSEGHRVLSAALPRRPDEVEAWMAELAGYSAGAFTGVPGNTDRRGGGFRSRTGLPSR